MKNVAQEKNKTLLFAGIAGSCVFTITTAIVGTLRPDYNRVDQFISELGETGGSYSTLMNYVGFMISAVLLFCFVVGLWRTVPRSKATVVATILTALFPIGMFAAGVFSCDTGCTPVDPSLNQILHDVASIAAFPPFVLGLFVWSWILFQQGGSRRHGLFTVVCAIAAAGLLIAMVASEAERNMTGLWQRLLLGTFFVWISLSALRFARTDRHAVDAASSST